MTELRPLAIAGPVPRDRRLSCRPRTAADHVTSHALAKTDRAGNSRTAGSPRRPADVKIRHSAALHTYHTKQ